MLKVQKWNFETREYEPYEVPDNWNIKTYCKNMDEIIVCPHCGRKFTFGECYTSKQIHTRLGMGLAVCGECYTKECAEEAKARRQNNG